MNCQSILYITSSNNTKLKSEPCLIMSITLCYTIDAAAYNVIHATNRNSQTSTVLIDNCFGDALIDHAEMTDY